MKLLNLITMCAIGLSVTGQSVAQTGEESESPTPKKVITTNLAAGKFYKMTTPDAEMKDELPVLSYSDGVKLTDEVLATSVVDRSFVGWKGKNAEVVVDLGSMRKIAMVRVHALSEAASGIALPAKVAVEVSQDRKRWAKADAEGAFAAADAGFSGAWSEVALPASEIRYVKVVFTAPDASDAKYAVDEIEAVGEFKNIWKCVPKHGCYHGAYAPLAAFNDSEKAGRAGPMGVDVFEEIVGKKVALTLWYRSMYNYGKYNYFDEMQALREQFSGLNFDGQYRFFMFGWEPVGRTAKEMAQGCMDLFFKDYFTGMRMNSVKKLGPVWLRPMNEQNSGWVPWGNDPTNYVKAWRRMYNIAEQIGITDYNIFVWSPAHASYPDKPSNKMNKYYPGDQYVDWIGVSLYPPEASARFVENDRYPITRFKEIYDLFNHKPVMASEGAFSGTCDKERWTREWFEGIKAHYPMVKAMVWENHVHTGGVDRRIQEFPEALEIYRELVQDPYWLDAIPTTFDN